MAIQGVGAATNANMVKQSGHTGLQIKILTDSMDQKEQQVMKLIESSANVGQNVDTRR
ncbi:MAG: hypothetical protein ACQEP7_06160 [bacterium]